jgi:hypothetical protein
MVKTGFHIGHDFKSFHILIEQLCLPNLPPHRPRPQVTLLHCQDLANSAWSFARLAVNDEALLGQPGGSSLPWLENARSKWGF